MYTLFLIGIAVAILLGAAFIATIAAFVTTCLTVIVFRPIFGAMKTTWTDKGDSFTPCILKLLIYAAAIVIPAIFVVEYWPAVIGVYIGFYLGFRKVNKELCEDIK